MALKLLIPKKIRLQYRVLKRNINDLQDGLSEHFAHIDSTQYSTPFRYEISQPLGNMKTVNGEIHNIKAAGKRINKTVVLPSEIFSFWKIVGRPILKNEFTYSRNLIDGKLVQGIGGGLCQVSGAIYFLALKYGLEIIERHNHSVDIYKEADRYAPLGSDATVVYGYKDLRVRNNFPFPIKFEIEIREPNMICRLYSTEKLYENSIVFRRNYSEKRVEVKTIINGNEQGISSYSLMNSTSNSVLRQRSSRSPSTVLHPSNQSKTC